MDTLTSDRIMHDGAVSRRLVVLIALGDASRAERLAASLAASDDLLPVVAGRADVAIVDDSSGGAVPAAIPRVLLSGRAGERPAGEVLAVLQTGADDLLIAAAARLAAAGYRVSGERRTGRHEDFHTGDGEPFEDEASDEHAVRPSLSPREAEVLALLAEGAPNKVIARRLNISVHTAKFHVAAILIKLGAANRTDAIATAMRQGLVLV
ncbi:LuxR family transcriptional regulator [Mesorhizobium sp. M7A.F.Ca.US.014.04.1.1]|uniref:helix-turn-helix transcriptional regulator n=1 Tax=Mesorhizobium TaxID=68287 RepID=UPI0007A9491C|nr:MULTISPECIES: helix-turn-helix transcriptional regulator [Mesorhizobium]RUZ68836.1 LuxR family transcriptional regulator [Mesorhizobium sp. M7A.F.Ca.US.003.02.2.1]AMX94296.1 helix-turn-helix transcriptional regulator [Mesorhizobium ciceri]ARP64065.1 LuxR family transcriptional regulator [Mesorhizobium sp. WSM1497]MBZ9719369.1 helix-turn-helix transcriptional regulator [Mesorhizobium sp. AD1-1]MDF3209078.1 helix-turn-helix transcriptional regulator [Mesorhizobium sp. LMG15046]